MIKKKSNATEALNPRVRWLSEPVRGGTAGGVAAAVVVVTGLAVYRGELVAGDSVVLTLFPYLVVYLGISVVAFSRATKEQLCAWARRESRGSFMQRYLLGTAPGPGTALFIAASSMIVAVVWLPTEDSGLTSRAVRVTLAIALVAGAWATVAVSFAIAYLGDDIQDHDTLAFPNTPDPTWSDYVYFAIGVMATLGTTDVQILSPVTRRTVAVHSIIAWGFNTIIVATVVSALAAG